MRYSKEYAKELCIITVNPFMEQNCMERYFKVTAAG